MSDHQSTCQCDGCTGNIERWSPAQQDAMKAETDTFAALRAAAIIGGATGGRASPSPNGPAIAAELQLVQKRLADVSAAIERQRQEASAKGLAVTIDESELVMLRNEQTRLGLALAYTPGALGATKASAVVGHPDAVRLNAIKTALSDDELSEGERSRLTAEQSQLRIALATKMASGEVVDPTAPAAKGLVEQVFGGKQPDAPTCQRCQGSGTHYGPATGSDGMPLPGMAIVTCGLCGGDGVAKALPPVMATLTRPDGSSTDLDLDQYLAAKVAKASAKAKAKAAKSKAVKAARPAPAPRPTDPGVLVLTRGLTELAAKQAETNAALRRMMAPTVRRPQVGQFGSRRSTRL
jgi:hypothetical protein